MEIRSGSKASIEALPGLPDHEVLQELGRGGMGVVYLATNKVMGRKEVLKVVNPQMLTEPGAMDRFLQEIRSAAQLNHPNIVTAHAVLRSGESLVLAMEHIVGENLHKIIGERGPLPVANACYYVRQVAMGLQHAYEKGMVHRDIKPDNLMLAREGKKHVVKILDFGLAKATREKEDQQHNLTGAGKMMGTPDYIAPEQILDAAKADIRADIYSLGCTLYFLLTGSPPFKDGSLYEKLQAHMSRTPTSVHELRSEVPLELAQIVDKMMAKKVADRYQKPLEAALALAPFIQGVKSLPPGDKKADATGKSTTLKGASSSNDAYTLIVEDTPKTMSEAAPKRTMIETKAPGTLQQRPKAKPTPSAPPASKAKWVLLIVGGLGMAAMFTLLLCVAGLWFGGVFSGKTKSPLAGNQEVQPQPAWNQAAIPQPGQRQDETLPVQGKDQALPVQRKDEPPTIEDAGFVPLFNGLDFRGWKVPPAKLAFWRLDNGVLVGSGPAENYLYSERNDFKDFHLRVKTRISDGGNSGIFFRALPPPIFPKKKSPITPLGYEAQINSSHSDPRKTGSLIFVGVGPGFQGTQTNEVPPRPNDWFHMDILAEGPRIIIKVNGATTADFFDNTRRFNSGHIALQLWGPQTRVEFAKIEIKEMLPAPVKVPPPVVPPAPPPVVPPTPKEEPGVPLFNGKDLAGWKSPPGQTDQWRVANGILTGPEKKVSYLYTERDDFKNFHLRTEARVTDGSNAGLYFRVADMIAKRPQGYRVQLNCSDLDLSKAGSLFNGLSTELQAFRKSLVVPGKWFTMDMIAVRDQLVVKIDGTLTANYTDEKLRFASGHIVLEQADPQTLVDIRKIEIRELAPDAKMPDLGVGATLPPATPPAPVAKGPGPAPDPGAGGNKIVLNLKGVLNAKDKIDLGTPGKIRGRFKVHTLPMNAGKTYVISLNSNAFDAYLRLESPVGQIIAQDDDSGGALNARIIHRCTASGIYRIIATSFNGKIGPYQLIVQEMP